MSGAVSGVAKRIQEVAPSAVYVHCYAHRLNLVIVDTCKTVKEAANFFALLQQLYVFVSGSNVHQRWLQIQAAMFPGEQPRELKRLSDSRWACRADACVVVKTRLKAILRLLHRISEDDDGERAVEATGLLAQMDERFAARLVLMSTLLQKTKSLSTMLQQDDVDLSAASNLAAVIIDELQDMRSNDDTFCEIWQEVDGVVNDCRDDLAPTRRRRAPRPSTRLEGYHVLEATGQQEQAAPEVDFKVNFMFPVLDRMLQEMRGRFSDQNCRLMKGIDALTPSSENFLSPENLKALQETYGADQEDLRHELHQVKRLIERKASKEEAVPKSMQGLVNFLEPYKDAFFELYRLSKIAAIIPVTSASCERSFSAMKLIKTYLRNSMGNERLSDLGMLSIEKLNMDEFVDKFAASHKNRRIKFKLV
ncbi:zinc finger MYM-type protein 1-like [Patiria miniata]|uniref:HAT C-terminal dimerisation domain-containing protein n=1 Tax=Patiria miniata TaxID=46514 RepID=A0A914AAM5_PATMI|nr:zinc finger MYM-type protein 1-like [Patiria miniata]